jgi:putative spermidine/putrescine transport system substrate-binding protein
LPPDPLQRSRQERQDPEGLLDKLPPAAAYEKAVFPTLDEQGAAKEAITKNWDSVVGANVK